MTNYCGSAGVGRADEFRGVFAYARVRGCARARCDKLRAKECAALPRSLEGSTIDADDLR